MRFVSASTASVSHCVSSASIPSPVSGTAIISHPPPATVVVRRAMDVQDALFLQEAEDETLAASSSSSSSSSDQGWQKVTYPKRQRKATPAKPVPSDPRADPHPTVPSSSYVFASLEQKAQERRRALESAALAAAAAEGAGPTISKPAARHAFDSDEDDSSDAEGAAGKEEGAAEGAKKVKPKKPKKPKVTLVEAASKIDAEDLASFLVEIGQSYEAQPDIQLMRFADYFGRSFAAVTAPQFPWAKMFKECPIAKIADVPVCHISESVYKTSVDWIGQRPTEALGTFVLWSLDSILNDSNRQQATSKGSKKVLQQSSTKSQEKVCTTVTFTMTKVAIFLVLALTLRRKPDVLLNILPALKEDPRYKGLDKLPVILWVIAQASQGDPVVGMYAWVHNLLPLMCAKLGGNPQVRDLVLQLAERILSGPKSRPILLNGAVRKGERLVPPLALDQLMRLTFPSPSARVKATERFEAVYPFLKELALAGSPGAKAMKPVSQQLLPITGKAMRENIPELSKEAADIFLWCLTQNPECFKQWEKLHMENVEASVVILRKLSDEWMQHAAKFSPPDALRATLKNLRAENEGALAEDLDADRRASVKEADKYCKVMLGKVSRCSACKKSSLLVIALAIAAGAFAVSPDAGSWDWKKPYVMFSSPRAF